MTNVEVGNPKSPRSRLLFQSAADDFGTNLAATINTQNPVVVDKGRWSAQFNFTVKPYWFQVLCLEQGNGLWVYETDIFDKRLRTGQELERKVVGQQPLGYPLHVYLDTVAGIVNAGTVSYNLPSYLLGLSIQCLEVLPTAYPDDGICTFMSANFFIQVMAGTIVLPLVTQIGRVPYQAADVTSEDSNLRLVFDPQQKATNYGFVASI